MRTLLITIMAVLLTSSICFADSFVLVANNNVPVDSVNSADAKGIFLGKKGSWGDGTRVKLVIQSRSGVHATFVKSTTGKTAQQFATFWKKALFTGQGIPPLNVTDDAAMVKRVASTPGAIGYVSKGYGAGSVKVIQVK
jgi:ABC-type phosphate transport system substrate-binding protein